jgi:hypothetical protein
MKEGSKLSKPFSKKNSRILVFEQTQPFQTEFTSLILLSKNNFF